MAIKHHVPGNDTRNILCGLALPKLDRIWPKVDGMASQLVETLAQGNPD
jgi:hypothetical protein